MIELNNICAGYGSQDVIHQITYTLQNGKNLAIVGPNGCGKTTLLRVMAGLLPAKGSALLNGIDVFKEKRGVLAKKVALMSQIPSVSFGYTVKETVEMGRYAHREKGIFASYTKQDKEIVDECLEATGVQSIKDKRITELSGGQIQRVFLARTLAQQPEIILLDEPTNHMDIKHQAELLEYLIKWSAKDNHTVVGVLHDLTMAMQLADDAILLKNGKVTACGNLKDVFTAQNLKDAFDINLAQYMKNSLKRWEDI